MAARLGEQAPQRVGNGPLISLAVQIGEETYPVADFTHLPTACKFVAIMPQWDFLDFLAREAQRCSMPYVSRRWLGGMLTNFKTVKTSIKRLKDMEAIIADGGTERMSKKEALMFERELEKLNKAIGPMATKPARPNPRNAMFRPPLLTTGQRNRFKVPSRSR